MANTDSPTGTSSEEEAAGALKLAGYVAPLPEMAGWIAAVRSIPEETVVVESRYRSQVLGQVSRDCYLLISPDDFTDCTWALQKVVEHAGGPPKDAWSFACESYGDVLVTYFFV